MYTSRTTYIVKQTIILVAQAVTRIPPIESVHLGKMCIITSGTERLI